LEGAEQFHEVPGLEVLKGADGILDLPAQPLVDATSDELVELLDRVLPGALST
jgi:hypothetical protein